MILVFLGAKLLMGGCFYASTHVCFGLNIYVAFTLLVVRPDLQRNECPPESSGDWSKRDGVGYRSPSPGAR